MMIFFRRSKLLSIVVLCYLWSSLNGETIVVHNPRETLTKPLGATIKLKCNAEYDFNYCGFVEVSWYQKLMKLTDSQRYSTEVSETDSDKADFRKRQVVTEILRLSMSDEGIFQCRAKCEGNGQTAMGQFITIEVKK